MGLQRGAAAHGAGGGGRSGKKGPLERAHLWPELDEARRIIELGEVGDRDDAARVAPLAAPARKVARVAGGQLRASAARVATGGAALFFEAVLLVVSLIIESFAVAAIVVVVVQPCAAAAAAARNMVPIPWRAVLVRGVEGVEGCPAARASRRRLDSKKGAARTHLRRAQQLEVEADAVVMA